MIITVLSYAGAALAGLLVWAAVGGEAFSLAATRLKRRRPAPPPPECVTVIRKLPPVPATRSELAYLRDQPVQVLRGWELEARFADVIDSARRAEEQSA